MGRKIFLLIRVLQYIFLFFRAFIPRLINPRDYGLSQPEQREPHKRGKALSTARNFLTPSIGHASSIYENCLLLLCRLLLYGQ
jgi:hypothetical protein